ncbi:AraC family transcriptional regulator [Enterococcus diestrammenae]|uniref:AraC family transcriptional regulator n=1 Tax=Enterococcus diestrammenae TaxID=1155073 RepID=UPI0019560995
MFLESKDRIEFFFNDYLLDNLTVVNFGHERCLPNHSFGPQVRDYFVLHYILNGQGTFKTDDTIYSLKRGSFFLISPTDTEPIYQADEVDPWEYIWFGLEGDSVEKILEELGYSEQNRVGKLQNFRELHGEIDTLIHSSFLSIANPLQIQGKLISLFAFLSMDGQNPSLSQSISQSQKYIDQFTHFIRQNYWKEKLSIQQIADNLDLNNSYLSKIIGNHFGQTPLEYLIRFRMIKARFLIENTDHTVSSIAKAVGYSNPLSFSRAYKRVYGHSPRNTPSKDKTNVNPISNKHQT